MKRFLLAAMIALSLGIGAAQAAPGMASPPNAAGAPHAYEPGFGLG